MAAESRECCLSRAMGSSCRGRETLRTQQGSEPTGWMKASAPQSLGHSAVSYRVVPTPGHRTQGLPESAGLGAQALPIQLHDAASG